MINLLILILIIGIIIFAVDKLLAVKDDEVLENINEILPQANCGKCGYAGCKQFAEALINGESTPEECHLISGRDIKEINSLTGGMSKKQAPQQRFVAVIDEEKCIGCTKCILNCPTDCIIGSAKKVHTVVQKNCSGCGLCVENCPAGAIKLVKVKSEND